MPALMLPYQVPVVDGYTFQHLAKRLDVAGRSITNHLVDLLIKKGYALNRVSDFEAVRQIKEDICYIVSDYKKELKVILLKPDT